MAYIKYHPRNEITIADQKSASDNILKIHSVHGKLMKDHQNFYQELMFSPGPLSRIQREMIAVVVSAENECHY